MSRFALSLIIAAALAVGAQAATTTSYVVGTCKPGLPSYSTISEAVAAVPAGSTILVCPGTYAEQPVITQSLTLRGITIGNAGAAVIVPPSGGIVQNETSDEGFPLCAQLVVQGTTAVQVSNIVLNGTGATASNFCEIVGIYFQNGSGTVNHVQAISQSVGVWVDQGSTSETVTVENSSIQDSAGLDGIHVHDYPAPFTLTVNIHGNSITSSGGLAFGVRFNGGTGAISSNFISVPNAFAAINLHNDSTASPISGNTLGGNQIGVRLFTPGPITVTSNKIFNTSGDAIFFNYGNQTAQFNQITNTGTGIDLNCGSSNVSSNAINGAATGIANVPTGTATSNNTFFNTTSLRTVCP